MFRIFCGSPVKSDKNQNLHGQDPDPAQTPALPDSHSFAMMSPSIEHMILTILASLILLHILHFYFIEKLFVQNIS